MLLQILEVQQEQTSWLASSFRYILWLLTKGILLLLDGIFVTIQTIWNFKFFDNEYINRIYNVAIIVAVTWLVLKVILNFIMRFFVDEDTNISPFSSFKGVVIAIIVMFLVPFLFNWGYDLSSKMTQLVITTSSQAESSSQTAGATVTSMILNAFADDKKMTEENKKYFIENWWNVDYNEEESTGLIGSEYKYSFNTFAVFVVGLVVVVLLFFVGIQISKRIMELSLYKSIAPFVCTSLVNNKSPTFNYWVKGVLGAFLITTIQYLCMGIFFNVLGTMTDSTHNAIAILLIIIGALFFVISSPNLITALINANAGTLSNFREVAAMVAVGAGIINHSKYDKVKDKTPPDTKENSNPTTSSSNMDNTSNSNFDRMNKASNDFSGDNGNSINNQDNSTPTFGPDGNSDFSNEYNDDFGTPASERMQTFNNMNNSSFDDISSSSSNLSGGASSSASGAAASEAAVVV